MNSQVVPLCKIVKKTLHFHPIHKLSKKPKLFRKTTDYNMRKKTYILTSSSMRVCSLICVSRRAIRSCNLCLSRSLSSCCLFSLSCNTDQTTTSHPEVISVVSIRDTYFSVSYIQRFSSLLNVKVPTKYCFTNLARTTFDLVDSEIYKLQLSIMNLRYHKESSIYMC